MKSSFLRLHAQHCHIGVAVLFCSSSCYRPIYSMLIKLSVWLVAGWCYMPHYSYNVISQRHSIPFLLLRAGRGTSLRLLRRHNGKVWFDSWVRLGSRLLFHMVHMFLPFLIHFIMLYGWNKRCVRASTARPFENRPTSSRIRTMYGQWDGHLISIFKFIYCSLALWI